MKKLVWRLGKLPSVDELRELVKDKIITNEEAREILFNTETEEERDKKSLESEIKFLREMVDNLSKREPAKITEVIKYIQKPYVQWEWYQPYVLCAQQSLSAGTQCSFSSGIQHLNTGTTC